MEKNYSKYREQNLVQAEQLEHSSTRALLLETDLVSSKEEKK